MVKTFGQSLVRDNPATRFLHASGEKNMKRIFSDSLGS